MRMKRIDMATYPRRAHFELYTGMSYPYVGMTVEVDVADLLAFCKARKLSFYVMMIHAVALAADEVPEFRRRIDQGGIIEFEACPSSHVELKPDDTYAYCTMHHHMPLKEFIAQADIARTAARESGNIEDGDDAKSMYFISTVPWIHYTQVIQPTAGGEDSNPRFVWGKYRTDEGGRVTMPLSVLVHHALADGLHIARFYAAFDKQVKRICEEE